MLTPPPKLYRVPLTTSCRPSSILRTMSGINLLAFVVRGNRPHRNDQSVHVGAVVRKFNFPISRQYSVKYHSYGGKRGKSLDFSLFSSYDAILGMMGHVRIHKNDVGPSYHP